MDQIDQNVLGNTMMKLNKLFNFVNSLKCYPQSTDGTRYQHVVTEVSVTSSPSPQPPSAQCLLRTAGWGKGSNTNNQQHLPTADALGTAKKRHYLENDDTGSKI